jgi:hypothetical protein
MKRKPVYEEVNDPVAGYDEVRYQKAREKRKLLEQQSKIIITPDSPLKSLWNVAPVDNSAFSVDNQPIETPILSPNIEGHVNVASNAINTSPATFPLVAKIGVPTNFTSQAEIAPVAKNTCDANIAGHAMDESASNDASDTTITCPSNIVGHAINDAALLIATEPNITSDANITGHTNLARLNASDIGEKPFPTEPDDSQQDNNSNTLRHLITTSSSNIASHATIAWEPNIVSQLFSASVAESAPHANNQSRAINATHVTKQRRADIPRHLKLTSHANSSEEPSPVRITHNYSVRDREVTNLMQLLTPNEWKVYCYFLSVTHEYWVPELRAGTTHCWTTHPVIQKKTGIASNNTVGKTVESLEARGLIRRTYTARKPHEKSQYRVYLPFEMTGYQGKTRLVYERGDVK